jgi:hypothetical protein
MKNLIYTCIFFNKQYINLLNVLLESIYIYGNLNDNIDILIYTNTEFKNIIIESNFNCKNIIFEINNNYIELTDAFFARLDLFEFDIINNYNKILYLDSDIIIIDDINKIFDNDIDNIIYANEEGSIDNSKSEAWACSFFKDDLDKYEDKSAFSSGVLLFNNHYIIKKLFENIKNHVKYDKEKNILNIFYDQPYFVYHCKKINLINNKLLKNFIKDNLGDFLMNNKENIIVNDDIYKNLNNNAKNYIKNRKLNIKNILKDKDNSIIIHFNNSPGDFLSKYVIITNKFYSLKNLNIDIIFNNIKYYCKMYLLSIIENKLYNEENIFIHYYNKLENNNNFIKKLKDFINILLNKKIKNILFISEDNSKFYELIAFMTNKELNIMNLKYNNDDNKKIIKWNNNINTYIPYLNKINDDFMNNINSNNIINNYDLIYIDNSNFDENIELFEYNIKKIDVLSKNGTIIIINDLENEDINNIWSYFIEEYNLKNIDLNLNNITDDNIKIIIKN